jgi:outer membrane cobalamin receptor
MSRRPSGRLCRCTTALLFLLSAFVPAVAAADTLHGRVIDPDARPVAAADVIVARGGHVIVRVKSAADGRFGPIVLPDGQYDVTASAPGLRSRPQTVSLAGATNADVVLRLALSAVVERVVVSAAQVETTLSRVTDSVTVIDRSDLDRRQTETVADALRDVPGLGVLSSGGRGALTSLFPRGGESDYTLVLVDGVAQNFFGGGFDAAHIGTAGVERIEVVRGPQSALFGSGAIGSVVHIITRQAGPIIGNVTVEGGSHGTARVAAATSGSRGVWRWGAGLDGLQTDGDTRTFASIGAPVTNDDYERLSASASGGWSDRANRRVRLDVRVDRNERGFPGPYGADPGGTFGGLDTVSRGRNRSVSVGSSGAFGTGGVTHAVQATYYGLRARFASPLGASEDETRRITGRYQADVTLARLGLSAGWELTNERADNTFITGELSQPIPVRRNLFGLFAEGRTTLGARGFLNAGVRLERIARTRLESDPFAGRPAFDDDVVWSANPKVSAAWLLRSVTDEGWTRIRGGAGTGIKPPTAFDIAFTDNPGLKPERSRSVDVGLEHALMRSTIVADVTWFANRYDDLIIVVGSSMSGASRFQTDNIANARSRGIETGMRWQPKAAITVRGSWTWLSTSVLAVDQVPGEAPSPFSVGDPLVRRPRHQGSLEVGWTATRGSAFLSVNGRGRMLDLDPSFGAFGGLFDAPGYATVAAGGSWRLARGIDLTARVSNLFDREYEEALGFPALGRTVIVGVRVAGSR